eukprot:scaffold34650_cov219-Amphora_coffeaeformis.AAC.4
MSSRQLRTKSGTSSHALTRADSRLGRLWEKITVQRRRPVDRKPVVTQEQRQLAMQRFRFNWAELGRMEPRFRDDPEIVSAAIQQTGLALQYASPRWKDDPEMVKEAVTRNGLALEYATPRLQRDPDLLLVATRHWPFLFGRYAPLSLKDDQTFVLKAVQINGEVLQYVSDRLQNDRSFVIRAVLDNGNVLRYVLDRFRSDPDVVRAAVLSPGSLSLASRALREDADFMLEMARLDRRNIQYASAELQANPEFMLKMVRFDGGNFEYASAELRADRSFVLASLQQNGTAFRWISDESKADLGIILEAIQSVENVDQFWSLLPVKLRFQLVSVLVAITRSQQEQNSDAVFGGETVTNYANQQTRRVYKKIWVLGQVFGPDVAHRISQCMDINKEFQPFQQMRPLAAIFDAFAKKGTDWRQIASHGWGANSN